MNAWLAIVLHGPVLLVARFGEGGLVVVVAAVGGGRVLVSGQLLRFCLLGLVGEMAFVAAVAFAFLVFPAGLVFVAEGLDSARASRRVGEAAFGAAAARALLVVAARLDLDARISSWLHDSHPLLSALLRGREWLFHLVCRGGAIRGFFVGRPGLPNSTGAAQYFDGLGSGFLSSCIVSKHAPVSGFSLLEEPVSRVRVARGRDALACVSLKYRWLFRPSLPHGQEFGVAVRVQCAFFRVEALRVAKEASLDCLEECAHQRVRVVVDREDGFDGCSSRNSMNCGSRYMFFDSPALMSMPTRTQLRSK